MIPGLFSLLFKTGTKGTFFVTLSVRSVTGVETGPGSVTSTSVTAIPSGGVAPYTYVWHYYSGAPGMTIDNSTSATTTFTDNLFANDSISASYYCRVTDSSAAIVDSGLVTVSLRTIGS